MSGTETIDALKSHARSDLEQCLDHIRRLRSEPLTDEKLVVRCYGIKAALQSLLQAIDALPTQGPDSDG